MAATGNQTANLLRTDCRTSWSTERPSKFPK